MNRLSVKGFGGILAVLIVLIALPALALAAGPDVAVTAISVSPATAKVGQQETVTATIKNVGDATATGVWAYFTITSGSITYAPQNVAGMALDTNDALQTSIQFTPVVAGAHIITVTTGVPEDADNSNDVKTLNINVVDVTPPTVSVSHSSNNPQVGNAITITADASDNVALAEVKVYVDGTNVITCAVSPCRFTVSYSSPGVHNYYATAKDASGNTARDPLSGTYSINVVDTIPPTVSVSHSPNSLKIGEGVTITATATDNVAVSNVKIYVDNVNVKTCLTPTCTYTNTYNSRGVHTYYATSSDSSGNTGREPASGTDSFSVTGGPNIVVETLTVTPSAPKVGQQVTATATIKNIGDVTATGAWANFVITSGSITYAQQNKTAIALDTNDVRQVSIQFTPVTAAAHTITVTSSLPADADNTNDVKTLNVNVVSSGTVQIKNFFVTPTLLADEEGCTTFSPLQASGYVKEDNAGTSDRVLIYVDGVLKSTVTSSAAQDGLFQSSLSDICFTEDGSHTVRADVVRGSGAASATASGTVDVLFMPESGDNETLPPGSTPAAPLFVDIEGVPRVLRLGAGTVSEYLLTVENLGRSTDTYEIKVTAPSIVDPWLDLETNRVTVSPGQTKYVSLFVDLPRNTSAGSYPINIIAQGKSTDIDRLYLQVENAVPASGAGVPREYAVDIEISPQKLDVEAEESGQYIVTVRNIGTKTDTYDLNALVSSKIDSWLTFEVSTLTLEPGEEEQVKLFVDVPTEAQSKSYPVTVEADGVAIDLDRATLTTSAKTTGFDVEVGKATVMPQKISSETAQEVTVKATVTFADLRDESTGENVLVRLYVGGESVERQTVFIPNGESKVVSFTYDSGESPVNAEAGVYDVYVIASVESELDRSQSAQLTLVQPGAVTFIGLTVPASSSSVKNVNATANSEITLSMTIKNEDLKDNNYAVSATGSGALAGRVNVTPELITVPKGEVNTQDVKVRIGNAANGTYTVTLKAKSGNAVAEKSFTVNVNGGQVAEPEPQAVSTVTTNETDTTTSGTGFITATTGGAIAALVGLLLIALLVMGYYKTGDPLGLIKEKFGKKPEEAGGEEAVAEAFVKEAAAKPQAKSEKPLVWEGEAQRVTPSRKETPKGDWTVDEAEKTLLNLESIRDKFKSTAEEAGKVKQKLSKLVTETAGTASTAAAQAAETTGTGTTA